MKDSLGFANLIPSGLERTRVDQERSDRIDESEEPGTSGSYARTLRAPWTSSRRKMFKS